MGLDTIPRRIMEADGGISGGVSVSTDVVRRVASAEGVEPTELPPLYGAIDPDALDRFLASVEVSRPIVSDAVQFRYAGYRVAVDADGEVTLSPHD